MSEENQPARILVVDDMMENLVAYEAILDSLDNVEVLEASGGDEALAILKDNVCSLCLTDIQMPGMDGFELAEQIRANPKTADLPIIFISASHTDEVDFIKGYQTGGCDYITKPIQPKILLEKVRSLLVLARPWEKVAEQGEKIEEMDKEMERTSTGLQDLGYVISRDFQVPIRRLRQELLTLRTEALTKLSRESLDTLQTAFDRVIDMDRMAKNVLNYSRAHSRTLKKEIAAVSGIIDKAWSSHGFEVAERGVRLIKDPELPSMFADPFLLHMVIANFFAKGLEFITPPNLYLMCSVRDQGDTTRFELNCPQVGLTEEDIDIIQRILGRTSEAQAAGDKVNSSNLGLYLCSMAVARHGGSVGIIDMGTGDISFWFELPNGVPEAAEG